ncbi:TIGR03668 family PPOX class F420-dependent oxidoreductase [Dictyobacter arantiisoli]|uniref:PPOX class F420-dependent oxidoreductase n=1 Tax=Dictyobacter arantiisoli TaxID=2014874 RepID=A0A5A5TH91_9CHLR|nr:TIGR03668 family PPOX class F420-dependent oxidoreductase [Dictyobacter arantiisoli]GCF10682.1 PPOX class F420-dependent oxidoreductase [Dictyobacter arantiisoli]
MAEQQAILTTAESNFVQRQRVARLATSDEQGSPTLVPVCYAFDGHYFFTPLDEKPKRVAVTQLRRVHNIEARHEASLLIDQYSDDWSQLGYVQIYGHAELLYPAAPLHEHALPLLRARYQQYQSMALETLPIILITPLRIRSWGPAI